MGACISRRRNETLENRVVTDLKSSPKREVVCRIIKADTFPSCIKSNHSTPSSGHVRKESTDVFSILSKPCFHPLTINMSLSPSFNTSDLLNFKSSSLTSPTTYWRDVGDILSYDGVNQRICNRYDIGLRMLKAQISYGADPKALTTHGDRSCLMFAVLAEDLNFVKKLVGLGVDVNKTNRFGENALTLALGLESKDIARYLRINGALDKR